MESHVAPEVFLHGGDLAFVQPGVTLLNTFDDEVPCAVVMCHSHSWILGENVVSHSEDGVISGQTPHNLAGVRD